jgi:Male sterility protein
MSRKSSSPASYTANVSSRVIKEMQDLVDAYSSFPPLPSVSAVAPIISSGHVIFLSGTTGSLGSFLLDLLLRDDTVAKVYAFNRRGPSSASIMERHTEAFAERGLDPAVLQTYRHKYEILEGDLTKENFGLTEAQYLEMAASVTIIVHNGKPNLIYNPYFSRCKRPNTLSLLSLAYQFQDGLDVIHTCH